MRAGVVHGYQPSPSCARFDRTDAPRLARRFGDVEMQDVFRRLDEEYDTQLAQAKSAKAQERVKRIAINGK